MAEIKITLRIVGLYFNKPVHIENKKGLNVKDVMDKYRAEHPLSQPNGLDYLLTPAYTTEELVLTTIKHNFSGDFDFDASGTTTRPPDGPSLDNVQRKSGIYTLGEDLEDHFPDKRVGLAWQYYVVSPTGKVKSKTPVSRKFKRFDATPPDYTLENDDTIIWRLVAIAREPDEAMKYETVPYA